MWSDCIENGVATLRCVPVVINNVVNAALVLSAITAVFFIVFAGIKFSLSGGDQIRIEKARKTMTFAIIGLVIVLLSFVIINVVARVTGTDCIVKVAGCN